MKIDMMTGHNLAEAKRSVTFTIIMFNLIIIRENKIILSLGIVSLQSQYETQSFK